MLLRKKAQDPQRLMQAGLLFLVLANLAHHFLPRIASLPEDLADGAMGLFYGLAIGLLLLSFRRGKQPEAS